MDYDILKGIAFVLLGLIAIVLTFKLAPEESNMFDNSNVFKGVLASVLFIIIGLILLL